ncbi:hypothetical protein GCM10020254_43510 [Streptomyces goshikiensis]
MGCGSGTLGMRAVAFGGASLSVTVRPLPVSSSVPDAVRRAASLASSALVLLSPCSARASTRLRTAAVLCSSWALFWLRSWITSDSFRRDVSVRMFVPLDVLKLVTKIRPAKAKTAAVSSRAGRSRRRGPTEESSELLNVPFSFNATGPLR